MAKFDKIAVLNKIGSTGMVPVFYLKMLLEGKLRTIRRFSIAFRSGISQRSVLIHFFYGFIVIIVYFCKIADGKSVGFGNSF